jgi:hypothetical protein
MARLLGPLLFICGVGREGLIRAGDEDGEGRGWKWGYREVPVGGEAIRSKDTE